MTNLNKEREEIIYELLLSLNNGNACYVDDRVRIAIDQYNQLVENKIVKTIYTEEYNKCDCDHKWELMEQYWYAPDDVGKPKRRAKFMCIHCGATEMRDI